MSPSGHDLSDETDSEPPTGVHDIPDLRVRHGLLNTHGTMNRLRKDARATHAVATEALDTATRIETKIDTAINTIKLVAMLASGAFVLGSGMVGLVGYALAHFSLK